MPGGLPSEVARERERVAWQLRQECLTEARIAERLGVSQPAVSKMLARFERRMLKQMKRRVEGVKAQQTAQLSYIADEAMQAWHRSKQDAETVKVTEGDAPGPRGPVPCEKTETTVKGQSGNPAHLSAAMTALGDIRKIWGLDRQPEGQDPAARQAFLLQLVTVLFPMLPPERHGGLLEIIGRQLDGNPVGQAATPGLPSPVPSPASPHEP